MIAGRTFRRSVYGPLIAIAILVALADYVLAGFLAAGEAADHARFHALFAGVILLVAGGLLIRRPSAGWAIGAPALGVVALAVTQFVESIGAYGYDAFGLRQTELANVHDVGVMLSLGGMVLGVLGIAAGVFILARRLSGALRVAGLAVSVVLVVVGLLGTKTLTGF